MNTPRLVVLDLDGTVVKHSTGHVEPSPAVIKALAAVRAAGVPVAVATGRAIWGALPIAAQLGLTDGLVSAAHGAMTYDLTAGRIIDSKTLDPAHAVERMLAADPSVAFAVELDTRGWRHTPNFQRDFATEWADIVDLDTLSATRTTRLAVRLASSGRNAGQDRCPRASKLSADAALDQALYSQEVGFNGWIDVGPAGVSKATGAAAIAKHYGVSSQETIVFGDGNNDLSMFGWAGHAVAMGQAGPEVRAAADEVAPSVDDDGVAAVLGRWFS